MRFRASLVMSITCFALVVGSVHGQSNAAPVLVPGLWEITVQTRSPILAAPISHTVCIDKRHVMLPEPPKSKPADDCQVAPNAAASNETAYTVRCQKLQVTTTSRFTYSGDHFAGSVTITSKDGEIQQVYTAVRVGECDNQPALTPPGQ